MKNLTRTMILTLMLGLFAPHIVHAASALVPDRFIGKADAPITVEEFVSLTCSHCADFYTTVLPELEEKYAKTGKVRFVLRDYPMDGIGLKAATLARCMPEDSFHPFIKTLFSNQKSWMTSDAAEKTLIQYAKLGGLSEEKAAACLKDEKMMDAIVAERTEASLRYNIAATPSFVINGGEEKIQGAMPPADFAKMFDRILANKKK